MTIRVLEVLATLKRAGAETVAVSLARLLDPARFQTCVVSLYDPFPGGYEPVLDAAAVPVRHLGKRRGFDPRMYGRLSGVLESFRPHIVHTHSYVLRYTLPVCLRARPAAMVHTIHNIAERDAGLAGRLTNRMAFRWGVAPVAVSRLVAGSFERVYGYSPASVIPNGVDTQAYSPERANRAWRREQGFPDDDILIASVARLDPQKNPLGLLEAFADALREEPRCRLLMAGAGSLDNVVRERAAELNLASRVHLLGMRDDVSSWLACCDLFALASHWEGNPIAVLEAMAAGLPVAATAVGGVPEAVADGLTGILVAPGDMRALAAALVTLARDGALRRRMGGEARARAAGFDAGGMVDSYAALFESLVEGKL